MEAKHDVLFWGLVYTPSVVLSNWIWIRWHVNRSVQCKTDSQITRSMKMLIRRWDSTDDQVHCNDKMPRTPLPQHQRLACIFSILHNMGRMTLLTSESQIPKSLGQREPCPETVCPETRPICLTITHSHIADSENGTGHMELPQKEATISPKIVMQTWAGNQIALWLCSFTNLRLKSLKFLLWKEQIDPVSVQDQPKIL